MSATPSDTPAKEEPSSLTQPYIKLAPSGLAHVGTPPAPRPSSARIYLPVTGVTTSAGGEANSSDDPNRHLWLTAATGGFKVEWAAGERGEDVKQPILIRDSRKNVRSVVFNVDQHPTAPTASIILGLAAIDGTNNQRSCTINLDLLHPAYSSSVAEKLKVLLRSWQQKSPSPAPAAVLSPLIPLSPSDLRPSPKSEGYRAAESSTWVGDFPPPVPSPGTLEETEAERAAKKKKKKSKTPGLPIGVPKNPEKHAAAALAASVAAAATAPKIEGSPYPDSNLQLPPTTTQQQQQPQAGPSSAGQNDPSVPEVSDGEPIYWNDTGRQRRKSTLGVKSYAVDPLADAVGAISTDEDGLPPSSSSGGAGRAKSSASVTSATPSHKRKRSSSSVNTPASTTSNKKQNTATTSTSTSTSTFASTPSSASAPVSAALPRKTLPSLPANQQRAQQDQQRRQQAAALVSTSLSTPTSSSSRSAPQPPPTPLEQPHPKTPSHPFSQPQTHPDFATILSLDRERVSQLYTYVSQLGSVVTQVAAQQQKSDDAAEKRYKVLEEELKGEREKREGLEREVRRLVEEAKAKAKAKGAEGRNGGEGKVEEREVEMGDEAKPEA